MDKILKTDKKIWKKKWNKCKCKEYIAYRISQLFGSGLFLTKELNMYANKKVMSFEETNEILYDAIIKGKPFWAGRYGMTEMKMLIHDINSRLGLKNDKKIAFDALCNNAGFFPSEISYAPQFTDIMLKAAKEIDMHAIWPMNMEDFFVEFMESEKVILTKLSHLEPWSVYQSEGRNIKLWTSALKGKKVLVIHPFADTIKMQYENNREHIFEKIQSTYEILPEFELTTLKAVQTIAGQKDERFDTWFEALKYMEEECWKIDFDVAIIGCGAYGFPLADAIKKMGKVVIHLGGATQLMFGIIGKRWEENETFKTKVINETWTRPLEKECPINKDKVEEGCYW